MSSTHDYLLFFTNRGKVYRLKVYELPEAARTAKGRALVNLLPLREGERVQSVLSTRDFTEGQYLVFATRKGMIKKTEFLAYNTPIKADGIIAINIRDDDELVAVRRTTGRRHGDHGLARGQGRPLRGVRGPRDGPRHERRARHERRQKRQRVLAMDVARDDAELLVVTENGYGKRTSISEYPIKGRGTMGVKTITARREARRPGRRAGRPRAPGARVHLPVRDGPAHERQGHQPATAAPSQGVRVMNIRDDDGQRRRARGRDRGRRRRRAESPRSPARRTSTDGRSGADADVDPRRRARRVRLTTSAADSARRRYSGRTRERRWSVPESQSLRDPGGVQALGPEGCLRLAESTPDTVGTVPDLVPPAQA